MKTILKIVFALGIIVGLILFAIYIFGYINLLIFSYNFLTTVD